MISVDMIQSLLAVLLVLAVSPAIGFRPDASALDWPAAAGPTESMPAGLRWFAEHQPFTPINETLRGLLLGTHIGSDGIVAIAWCAAITVLGYIWSLRLYARGPRG